MFRRNILFFQSSNEDLCYDQMESPTVAIIQNRTVPYLNGVRLRLYCKVMVLDIFHNGFIYVRRGNNLSMKMLYGLSVKRIAYGYYVQI